MKPTIEEMRASVRERFGNGHAHAIALSAALDVAEGAAEHDCCDDKNCVINIFRATIAPSKPGSEAK
jgi:hypothetical protein